MKAQTILAILAIALAGVASAQFDFTKVDDYIQTQMARNGIPGVSIAITQGTKVVYLKSYGMADARRTLRPDTPMYIGSTSNSFTALAVMQLVEQGKLELDAPVQRYVPWFTLADEAAARAITVRHLLNHTSGLSDLQYVEIGRLSDTASIEEGVRDLRAARPVDPVGTKFHYFNPGYATLGLIVEKVSGLPYTKYIQQNILQPLGMTQTYLDLESAQRAGLAHGHSLMFGFPVQRNQPFRQYALPDGFIISTSSDLAHYLIALGNGGVYQGKHILSQAGMRSLFTGYPPAPFYAKGWMIGQHRGLKLIHHGGANEFFKHEFLMLPERGIGLSVLVNQGYLPSAFFVYNPMAVGILDMLLQLTFIGWQFSRLPTWQKWAARVSPVRRFINIALNFLLVPLIAVGIYFYMREFMGRGFALVQSFDGVPDAVLLLVIGFITDYIQGFYKLAVWIRLGQKKPTEGSYGSTAQTSR
jgi:CubicO group peptidase (beta-lactamase class C family)